MPHLALFQGYRVFVFDDDVDLANRLLEDEGFEGIDETAEPGR